MGSPPSRGPAAAPAWLLRPEPGLPPCARSGRARRRGFVGRTIAGAAGVLQQVLFADEVARRPGLLQRLDARAKLVGLLALLVAAALVRHVPPLVGLYAVALLLAAASAVPLGGFVRRVWLFVPLFTGVVVLPATLDVVTPGHVVLDLGVAGVTRQGLAAAALLVARVAVSISLVVLVTLATPWPDLLGALRGLRVPRLVVLVVGMSYRFLFVLLGAIEDMYVARRARAIAPATHGRGDRAFVAATAGALFGKAHALSEEIHQAMVSRGYRGDARTLAAPRLRSGDLAALAGCALLAALVLGIDRGLG